MMQAEERADAAERKLRALEMRIDGRRHKYGGEEKLVMERWKQELQDKEQELEDKERDRHKYRR